MTASVLNFLCYGLWWVSVLANGFFLYQICRPFIELRKGRFWQILLFLTLSGISGMVIWIGDPNMLYTMPFYFTLFLLCTKGNSTGRLAIGIVIFCLTMPVCAMLDTYVLVLDRTCFYDLLTRILRTCVFGILWLILRRRFPTDHICLSRRLWQLILGLAIMPLCALVAVVLLTFQKYSSDAVYTLAMSQGLMVLPFVLLTSVVILFAALTLADHEKLEQASRLAEMRELYYQGIQRQEQQARQLRHDLRNHLTVIQGYLEKGDSPGALRYVEQMAGAPVLRNNKRFCDNETANVVLAAKAAAMEQLGIAARFSVTLPAVLPVADTDLAALLGNALDNAMESTKSALVREIIFQCRADKGILMLRTENVIGAAIHGDLSTTKTDKAAHGFGLPGMREIAERYHGTLDAAVKEGRFILTVCLLI